MPLQYLLGTQPFGQLDIKCKPGVLIPRSETEAYTYHLARLLKSGRFKGLDISSKGHDLKIIDFCTGTGCIPLLLFALLHRSFTHLHVCGVDISPHAIQLAKENIAYNVAGGNLPKPSFEQNLTITQADVFKPEELSHLTDTPCDVIISNPPYISEDVWKYGRGQIGYSVKKFEPRLALVPEERSQVSPIWDSADIFYSRLLDIAKQLQAKVLLLEVGDEAQARRVLTNFTQHNLAEMAQVEVWRDWPDIEPGECAAELHITGNDGKTWTVPTVGTGEIRAILVDISKTS